jgi:hypothetical protein
MAEADSFGSLSVSEPAKLARQAANNPEQVNYERVSFNCKHDKSRTLAHRNGSRNIDPQEVTRLATLGSTNREIAAHFGVSDDTISRRFAGSLGKGCNQRRLSLRRRQTEIAMGDSPGSTAMLIFLGKKELGQGNSTELSKPCQSPLSLEALDALLLERKGNKQKQERD